MRHDLHLGHLVTFRDFGLKSNFEVDFSRSKYKCFDSSRRDKHDSVTIIAVTVKMKKVIREKLFRSKHFFNFGDPKRPNG